MIHAAVLVLAAFVFLLGWLALWNLVEST